MLNYVALGDSISIDEYPSLERFGHDIAAIGAASLFVDHLEEVGFDVNFARYPRDGATIGDIRRYQLPNLKRFMKGVKPHEDTIITLTAGGNDISFKSMKLSNRKPYGHEFDSMMNGITQDYAQLVKEIKEIAPKALLIVNTLYDPTDNTGELPNCGNWSTIAEQYSAGRRQLGLFIKYWVTNIHSHLENVKLVDIFSLFDGHGMKEKDVEKRWYYPEFMIEPGARGAYEIAAAWHCVIEAVKEDKLDQPNRAVTFNR